MNQVQRLWQIWTFRVFSVSLGVDIALMALAGRLSEHSDCSSTGDSGLGRLLAFIWLVAPPVALIVSGRRDQRAGRVTDGEGYAMGAVAIIVVSHFFVGLFFLRAAPSCGLLGG